MALGYHYLHNDILDKCLDLADLGLSKAQSKTRLIILKAECLVRLQKGEKAIQLLEKSIEISPLETSYYTELIDNLEDPVSVERWYLIGLRHSPRNETLLAEYAKFLSTNGRKKEALYRYKTLLDIAPKNTDYLTLIGNLYLELGLNNKALVSYEKAKSLRDEDQAWILANIGNILKNQGFYSKAIMYLNQALSINPDDEYAHDRLSSALKSQTEENEKVKQLIEEGQQESLKNEQALLTESNT